MYEILDYPETEYCYFYITWFFVLQLVLGSGLAVAVLCYRMYRLYYVFILHLIPEGFSFWWPLIVSWLPNLLFAIAAYAGAVNPKFSIHPIYSGGDGYGCTIAEIILFGLNFAFLLQMLFLWTLAYRVGRVKRSFDEFYENLLTLGLGTINLVVVLVMTVTGESYTVYGKTICFMISIICNLE